MKDIDILKQEEELCHSIWKEANDNYQELKKQGRENEYPDHMHVCDFELINFRYCKTRRKLNKLVEKECKEYLSSIGEKRNKNMSCCGGCIHNRYMTISGKNPNLILNIATVGIESNGFYDGCKGIEYLK